MTSKQPQSRIARFFAGIVDHPWLGGLVLIVCSIVALAGYYRPSWPQELFHLFRARDEPVATMERASTRVPRPSSQVRRDSLGNADAYLVVESDQIFSRDGAAALRSVVQGLEDLETVNRVKWLDQAPPLNIFGLSEPILPRGQASAQRFQLAKEKAIRHPLVVGMFLSQDARTLLLGIDFEWIFIDDESDCTTALVETAQQAITSYPNVSMKFSVTGGVPLRLAMLANQASNERTFQLIGYGMILMMAIILFRGFAVVCVVAAAPVLGVFWSLGFVRYFGWEDNPFSQVILPVLLSLVGFADGVHMMVFIRKCLSDGMNPRVACRQALSTVGVACSLTTITTSIGMGSLGFSRNEIVREFAYSCVLGSTSILVSVLLVIPLACCTPWGERLRNGADRGLIDRYLLQIGRPVMSVVRHSRLVAYVAIALLFILALCTIQLRPDDRLSNSLPSGSDAQRALAHLDSSMGGLDMGYIYVRWHGLNPTPRELASVVDEIDRLLDAEPLLAHPLSLCRLLAALPGDDSPVDKIAMAELLPPPLKLALFDLDSGVATLTFRVRDLGTAKYKGVFERLEAGLIQLSQRHPGFTCELDGRPIWRWRNLYKIVSDLATSLGTASIEILIVMVIAFRSLRLGLIAIVPNMIPLSAAGTFMAIFGWPLDIVSVCSFTICLGIAVDDTIHFLSRYREEQVHQPDRKLAIEQAFQGVGTGMILTTIVLIAGFSSVLISQTRDHRVFGMLGIITLVSAMLCDLFLLPSLLVHFDATRKKSP